MNKQFLSKIEKPDPICVLSSKALFNGEKQVKIEHHGEIYILRQTSQGKLILTK